MFNSKGRGDCVILAAVVRIFDFLRGGDGAYGKLLDEEF